MTQNRKRTRSNNEEGEFMPLSKRINNLHINNSLMQNNQNQSAVQWGPGPPSTSSFQLPDSPQSLEWNNPAPCYSPDLSEQQNPHYFNINKLLFEMYVERLRRESR